MTRTDLPSARWHMVSTGLCALLTSCGGASGDGRTDGTSTSGDADSSSDSTGTEESETGDPLGPQGVDPEAGVPDLLSEMNLLEWDGDKIVYKPNVHPYELNTALFSDYALKDRAIFMPVGEAATYVQDAVFEFPVGTVILKSFMFPADFSEPSENIDLIETRVMVRFEEEWKAYPYIWDHELGDAVLTVSGEIREIDFIDAEGVEQTSNYLVPQKNQCKECHEYKDEADETQMTPIGPWGRHLNRLGPDGENQLRRLADAGLLEGLVPLDEVDQAWDIRSLEDTPVAEMSDAELTRATRDYLHINCAYCHNPRGVNGISSQLFLNYDNEDQFNLGVCKAPGSAGEGAGGFIYDIVPGDADNSILMYRAETLNVGGMMPLIGRSLAHGDGADLIRAWIDAMPPDDCGLGEPMP